ncbi:MAG TPA: DUF3303 family protein [Methanotrichaceae archaeon]|jgi:uncharacterized protein with GYD domain|nr:DUF3303 family protein [Methanotrichaceae archaeon]
MLFVLWFEWAPENTAKLLKLWKDFKYPPEVKLINRYLLIGRHLSVAIFEAPTEESILKITFPFKELGIPHVAPALPLDEALKMMEKM